MLERPWEVLALQTERTGTASPRLTEQGFANGDRAEETTQAKGWSGGAPRGAQLCTAWWPGLCRVCIPV